MLYLLQKERKGEIKMTKNEIKERIDRIKDLKFYLNMKDRWDFDDYRQMQRWDVELRQLNAELEKA